jgi:hypothetical protein
MRASRFHRKIAEAGSSDIIVYPKRRPIMGWMLVYGIAALIAGLFAIGMIILIITTPGMRAQVGASVSLIILMGSLCVLSAWPMLRLVSVAFSGEPILVINHAGISVRRIYASAAFFLPWEEVKAVYGGPNMPYTVFFVQPIHDQWFSTRLNPIERLAHRLNLLSGTIALPQSVLDQSVEAILEHMQKQYQQELHLLQTKIQAEAIHLSETGKQEIILYPPRWHLWAALFVIGITLLPGLALLFLAPRQLPYILTGLFFLGGSIVIGLAQIRKDLRFPVLVIDDEGISSPHILKHEKIKWEEIDAISGSIDGYLLIDASPSGIIAFLARRNKGQLAIPRHVDITTPQTAFTIPQSMLPVSLYPLLEQIRTRFQSQLERYNIELTSF